MAVEIILLPHDPEGARAYVEQYKAFRLLSLQTSPQAFGSTYAREVAFTNDVWYSRLTNPEASTFVALQSGHIVSTLTLLGPLLYSPEELAPSGNPWELQGGVTQSPCHYRINGMFTLPNARGQGIAKALIEKSKELGSAQAAKLGKGYVTSIVVEKDNKAAKSLYEKCGFIFLKEEPFSGHGKPFSVILMKYSPSDSPHPQVSP